MLDRKLIDKYTCVALEYGTYAPDNGLRAMQADHWLHNQGEVDWLEPKTQKIKAALKKHFYPASQDWKEIVFLAQQAGTKSKFGWPDFTLIAVA